jgi:hypothetical protein
MARHADSFEPFALDQRLTGALSETAAGPIGRYFPHDHQILIARPGNTRLGARFDLKEYCNRRILTAQIAQLRQCIITIPNSSVCA